MARPRLTISTDPETVTRVGMDRMQQLQPGTQFPAGSLMTALFGAHGAVGAFVRDAVIEYDDTIAIDLATKTLGVPRNEATNATGTVRFAFTDTLGDLIPAGTGLSLRADGGIRYGFLTTEDAIAAAGTAQTNTVGIIAAQSGVDFSGLFAEPLLDDGHAHVASITVIAGTTGGQDAETDDAFLTRFGQLQTLSSPMPITPDNFAAYARTLPGVYRALGIQGYVPPSGGQEGMTGTAQTNVTDAFSIAVIDPTGMSLSSAARATIQAFFKAKVVTGSIINVIGANYPAIGFDFRATSYPTFNGVDVRDRAIAAVRNFLDPGVFATAPYGDQPLWIKRTIVRVNDLIGVLEAVDGLDQVTQTTMTDQFGSITDQIVLDGVAPLTTRGTIAGRITDASGAVGDYVSFTG